MGVRQNTDDPEGADEILEGLSRTAREVLEHPDAADCDDARTLAALFVKIDALASRGILPARWLSRR